MAKGDKIYYKAIKIASQSKYDPKEVLMLLNKAVNLENPKAAYALATWYLFGKHVKKNFKKAFELLLIATSNSFDKNAFYDIAICYEEGKGTSKNYRLAYENYLLSALNGDNKAIYDLGRCYYYGIGVEKDKNFAEILIKNYNRK